MSIKEEKAEAIRDLTTGWVALKPGETVYTSLVNCARSGMTRWIDLFVMRDNQPQRITWLAARATGYTYDRKREALKIGGCGMDMGFQAVYQLSSVLFRNGFDCVGKGEAGSGTYCPSNDHSNGDRDYTLHHHDSGGYALRHRWL